MSQTANSQNKPSQKLGRPGQRQQERLQRIARRKRRQQMLLSIIVAVVLVALVGVGLRQYQLYTAQQHDLSVAATATGTAKSSAKATAVANVTATAGAQASATSLAQAVGTAYAGSPTPSAGPTSPPTVTQKPVTLPNGLQYIDIKTGSGPAAKAGSTVTVEYTGWLQSNGKKFDSSYDHGGQPFDVTPLGQAGVIPGWNEGLMGVQPGGTRRLIIPAALGYGPQANGPIPANSVLIFDITVLAVK